MARAKRSTVGVPVIVDVAPAEPPPSRAKRETGPGAPRGVVDDFGTRPAGVTHWRCYRVSDDGTRSPLPLEHESATTEMGVSRFPIAELAPSAIRKRWGGGVYKVEFLGPRPGKGTCIHLSWGQNVTIGDRARRAQQAEAVPAAVAPAPPPIDAFAMMNLVRQNAREEANHIEARVNSQMTGLAQLAAVLAGNNQAAQALAAQNQNAALAQALVALNARLDRIEAATVADDDEDDDDDDEDDDDEDDDEDSEEEEADTITKVVSFFDKHGPMIKMGLEYFAQNPHAVPASLSNGAATSPPASGVQVGEPQPVT
jgi:hypothetical protein